MCVIEAPRERTTDIEARNIRYPLNNIGPGNPIIAQVQGHQYAATIACLVTDGHRVYALTNRHVAGDVGETVWAFIGGHLERVGVSASKQMTRVPFAQLYPELPAQDAFINVDIGLIDLDDLSRWTTKIRGIGTMGAMADFSGPNLSLSLIGCHVRGVGAASGDMRGEIQGLFYRYKTTGGFEYVADLFIGPRSSGGNGNGKRSGKTPPFETQPGDSGTLWLLEPAPDSNGNGNGNRKQRSNGKHAKATPDHAYLPLAVEWGRHMLNSTNGVRPQSFALATLLSRVCALLEVDPVADWNVDQTDTWGSIGHFSIAARTLVALSGRFPKLDTLMNNNALIVSHDDETIMRGDFSGMGSEPFVPMADVPDFFWKPRVGKQGHTRPFEGPNHFADMDQPGPDGRTLLDLNEDDEFVNPDRWEGFYDSVSDILSGKPIAPEHRGLLPFRVWQLFDAMVEFAGAGQADKFVCAAGVLTHYVGDACQPLHISFLHDGDPNRPVEHTFSRGKRAGETEQRPLGQGVHSAYEDAMVHDHRQDILDGLKKTPKVAQKELVSNGFEAARAVIGLMRNTFELIPPEDLVQTFIETGKTGKAATAALWKEFGKKTISVMQDGSHLLAVLWESAWAAGDGETNVRSHACPDRARSNGDRH